MRQKESLESAAERWVVHPRTIRRMIARGEIPAYRAGRKALRVDPDEVDSAMRLVVLPLRKGGAA